MKKIILASVLSMMTVPAFATNSHPNTAQSASASAAAAAASSHSSSVSTATGGQGGNGYGGIGMGGSSQSDAQGGGATITNHSRVVVAPGLAGLAGTSCMGSTTLSGAGLTFALGFGTTWEDKECTRRENIKVVAQFNPDLAYQMVMGLSGVQEAAANLPAHPLPPVQPEPTVYHQAQVSSYSPCEDPAKVTAAVWKRYCE